jgi:hypothetical protein
MHDLVLPSRRNSARRRRLRSLLEAMQKLDLRTDGLLVELEGLFTATLND